MLSELSQKKESSLMSSTRTVLPWSQRQIARVQSVPPALTQGCWSVPFPSSCRGNPPSKEAENKVCGVPPGPVELSEMLAGDGMARKEQ